jgi:hypothetical protein
MAPILFIQPGQDRLVSSAKFAEMRRIKPSASIAAVNGSHLLFQREPERAAEILVRFVLHSS